jgi:hypothetical protein
VVGRIPAMSEVLQIIGAILILLAFAAIQRGLLGPHARSYLVLNLVGSAILTWVALDEEDWGFLLLEGVWALVSSWSLVQVLRGRSPASAH